MRSFIQYKPGATFYQESRVALVSRKTYIEYVFDLGTGKYGVINLKILQNQLLFIAKCGSFFEKLPILLHYWVNSTGDPFPNTMALLQRKNQDFFIGSLTNSNGKTDDYLYILYRQPYSLNTEYLISIAAKPEMISAARRLFEFTHKVFLEIQRSEDPKIRGLAQFFIN